MRFLIAFLAALLFATPAWAVCGFAIQDDVALCVDVGGGPGCVRYDSLVNGSKAKKALDLQDRLQDFVDFKLLLNGLPLDDTDRTLDPDATNIFHGTLDGEKKTELTSFSETYLVSRCAIITITVVDDNGLNGGFQIRMANP